MSELRDNTSASQYELDENGHTSFARYRKQDGVLTIMYVEAPPELRGTGAALRRGWPTTMGAIGVHNCGKPSAALPAGVPSQC